MILKNERFTLSVVWLALVTATLGSNQISQIQNGASHVASLIFMVASLKIFLIIYFFMELKQAPRKYTVIAAVWLATVTVMVSVPTYYF